MATHSAPTYNYRRRETDSGAFFKVAAVLGILVAVLGLLRAPDVGRRPRKRRRR